METDSGKLIDITNYRKKNHLKQSQLGFFFDTSASYVSLVETGNSKLSRRSLESFWNNKEIKDHTGLVPCYDRLVQLALALAKKGFYDQAKVLEYKFDSEVYYNYEPFEEYFKREIILSIKYGVTGISDDFAEKLKASFTPKINKDWLIYGKGDMFIDDTPLLILDNLNQYYEQIVVRLDRMERKIDAVMRALNIEDIND
jgi:transcriptional regulator with XRE-family HTH domain